MDASSPPESQPSPLDASGIRVAGHSDTGRQRDHNEDRIYINAEEGIFLVVDGVGGQAAGEVAAEIACEEIPNRLMRREGPVDERVREAIALANRAILKRAQAEKAHRGMACVLTVAVLEDGLVTVGHVGDTRLYEVGAAHIKKMTSDHSVVGYLEETGHLTEEEAMARPDRNQILREVGTEDWDPDDDAFIELQTFPFREGAALLMCSDGLTDLVVSRTIHEVMLEQAGRPEQTVQTLIGLANEAGGKDNISVIVVEGSAFPAPGLEALPTAREAAPPDPGPIEAAPLLAGEQAVLPLRDAAFTLQGKAPPSLDIESTLQGSIPARPDAESTLEGTAPDLRDAALASPEQPAPPDQQAATASPAPSPEPAPPVRRVEAAPPAPSASPEPQKPRRWPLFLLGLLVGVVLGALLMGPAEETQTDTDSAPSAPQVLTVSPDDGAYASIQVALDAALPGDVIAVDPGTYTGPIYLKEGITLWSPVPGEAVIAAPGTPDPDSAAVVARNLPGRQLRAQLIGFKIDGAERSPVGILIDEADVDIVNVEVTGTTDSGILVRGDSEALLTESRIDNNLRSGIRIESPASPTISRNLILDNGPEASGEDAFGIVVMPGAEPWMNDNITGHTGEGGLVYGSPADSTGLEDN